MRAREGAGLSKLPTEAAQGALHAWELSARPHAWDLHAWELSSPLDSTRVLSDFHKQLHVFHAWKIALHAWIPCVGSKEFRAVLYYKPLPKPTQHKYRNVSIFSFSVWQSA